MPLTCFARASREVSSPGSPVSGTLSGLRDWSTPRASQGLSNKVFPLAPWHCGQLPLLINLRPTRRAPAVDPGPGRASLDGRNLAACPVVSLHRPIAHHRLHRLPSLDQGSSTALQRTRYSTRRPVVACATLECLLPVFSSSSEFGRPVRTKAVGAQSLNRGRPDQVAGLAVVARASFADAVFVVQLISCSFVEPLDTHQAPWLICCRRTSSKCPPSPHGGLMLHPDLAQIPEPVPPIARALS
jgi:hypothetical protein